MPILHEEVFIHKLFRSVWEDFGQLYACLDCKAWVGVHHQTSRVHLEDLQTVN